MLDLIVRVLFAASEVFPFSKTGGLADVVGALPESLAQLGDEILVVSPWYAGLRDGRPLWIGDVDVPFAGGFTPVGVGTLERGPVRFVFVGHEAFRRERIYGYDDDFRRFALLTRAVPQVAARVGFQPDVVHVHDWHTALLPLVLERGWHLPEGWPGLKSVLTIHNAQHQGTADAREAMHLLRLPGELAGSGGAESRSFQANALKAGIESATAVTTVSPTYAQELLTPEYGYGLQELLLRHSGKFTGILNGLDYGTWDPASDPLLKSNYDKEDLGGKAQAKAELTRTAGLDVQRPLLGVVSRLAEQKGIDVLLDAAPALIEQGWSLFVLGSGDGTLESRLLELRAASPHVAAHIGYDEELAHLVYAGSDAVAIPSRFEPCGLSQMIAMRYGTLPIARATGGLRDTIDHLETGFLFEELSAPALAATARQALELYASRNWQQMMRAAMSRDFSWRSSARRYQEVYELTARG